MPSQSGHGCLTAQRCKVRADEAMRSTSQCGDLLIRQ